MTEGKGWVHAALVSLTSTPSPEEDPELEPELPELDPEPRPTGAAHRDEGEDAGRASHARAVLGDTDPKGSRASGKPCSSAQLDPIAVAPLVQGRHLVPGTILLVAPDVLDVVVATLGNPLAGLGVAVKKIAENAKEETKQA